MTVFNLSCLSLSSLLNAQPGSYWLENPAFIRPSKKYRQEEKKAAMTAINFGSIRLDDVFCTSNGSKICRLADGPHDVVLVPAVLRSPFNAGTFDKDPLAKRLNLQLAIDGDASLMEALQTLDTWAVDYLTEHSERIFKRRWTREQVQLGYVSLIRPPSKEGQSPLLKTKIDTEGRYAVCCWGGNLWQEQVSLPSTWAGVNLQPRLHISHLWIMGSQFGLVVRMTDARILSQREPVARTCPFQ